MRCEVATSADSRLLLPDNEAPVKIMGPNAAEVSRNGCAELKREIASRVVTPFLDVPLQRPNKLLQRTSKAATRRFRVSAAGE